MHIEQIYTNCLAQGAYFIESNGEAAVIDPLRETGPYIQRAEAKGVKIKYIFETHFHADFVSGHLDLAKKTGAQIIYGPEAKTDFEKYDAKDGEEFKVGDITIRVIHTPGHTIECSTFLLLDENGKAHAIFTGDTLFIGDVGRPDLSQKGSDLTQEVLAGWLYDSLRNKIMPLPDDVLVYPAHGAGSACGKNMSSETWSTLGEQKASNYALRADMTKDEFIKEVTEGLSAPPQYFSKNAKLNKAGYQSIDSVMDTGNKALSIEEFETLLEQEDILLLDVRSREEFVKSFIPGSIFIGLDGSFAPWVGALVEDLNQKIVFIAPEGREEETVRRLARVGYDNTLGYLEGGFETWKNLGKDVDKIPTIKSAEFFEKYKEAGSLPVIDVRKPSEYESKHIAEAVLYPLDYINMATNVFLDPALSYHVHCRSGYRSTVAISILKRRGYDKLINVQDSFDTIAESGLAIEGSCPSLIS